MNGVPSIEEWLREAKAAPDAEKCGMYLFHNGVVRKTAKAKARGGDESAADVSAMQFDYDEEKLKSAVSRAREMEGIFHVRAWLNKGKLMVGEDIMLVLVGGDTRPHVIDALQQLVGEIKGNCVSEIEVE